MSSAFDPYHKWLGISAADQPANHYRLLGISNFEDDADVIEAGADQRMLMLRSHQAGKHATHSQKLLNEVSKAKITLLDPQRRAAYDKKLRAKLAPRKQPTLKQRAAQETPVAAVAAPVAQPAVSIDPLPPMANDVFANAPAFQPQPMHLQQPTPQVWTGAPQRRPKGMFTSASMMVLGAAAGVILLGVVIIAAAIFAISYQGEDREVAAAPATSAPKSGVAPAGDRIPVFERKAPATSPKPEPPSASTIHPPAVDTGSNNHSSPAPVSNVVTETRRVTIPANKRDGYSVGPLAKGQSIKLRYASGRWKSWGRIPEIVPDKTEGKAGDRCRMAIVDYTDNENVLLLCPEGTQSNPYTFTAPKDIQNLVLRINDNDGNWNNPGKAIYEITAPRNGYTDNTVEATPAVSDNNGIQAAFTSNSAQAATLSPGLLKQEFAPVANQGLSAAPDISEFVEQRGAARVMMSVGKWAYNGRQNAVASGYLKIDQPGEYQFNSNNFYDRNSLWIGGRKVCGFRDGEGKIAKVQLPAGYVRFRSIGYIHARGTVTVKWIPPGQTSLSVLPDSLIFHIPGEPVIDANKPAAPAPDSNLADLRPISKIASRPLIVGDPGNPKDWKKIPPELQGGVARIFDQGFHKLIGKVEFEISAPGMIYVVGHFKYQGSGGDWQKEQWLPADFKRNGWTELKEKLVTQSDREYIVYGKYHQPAKLFRLRVNKYTPPFLICRPVGN